MAWARFLASTVGGALVWAAVYGFGAWYLGQQISRLAEPVEIALAVVAIVVLAASFMFFRRHEAQLQQRAEAALPGPLRRSRRLESSPQK
jgi:membrane protein DedA with SNARE-associated domain